MQQAGWWEDVNGVKHGRLGRPCLMQSHSTQVPTGPGAIHCAPGDEYEQA